MRNCELNFYKTIFNLFLPGVEQHAGCDGMRRGSRRRVNGPVNNGASASLHSVSIWQSCCSQAPWRGDKCSQGCQVAHKQTGNESTSTRNKSIAAVRAAGGFLMWKGKPEAVCSSRRGDAVTERRGRLFGGAEHHVSAVGFRGSAHLDRETRAHCCHLTFHTQHVRFHIFLKSFTFREKFIDLCPELSLNQGQSNLPAQLDNNMSKLRNRAFDEAVTESNLNPLKFPSDVDSFCVPLKQSRVSQLWPLSCRLI